MWDIEGYDWQTFDAYRDTRSVPGHLAAVLNSDDESQWLAALSYLESCASDLGIPCSITPAVVGSLISIAIRVSGRKRTEVLSLLEELTCGRGVEQYTDSQREWLRDAIHELVFAFKFLVHLMEYSTVEDAERSVDMLAYCAEYEPALRERVLTYFALCQKRFPHLEPEIRAVSRYFSHAE